MIEISTNENNANRSKLQKNEPLRVCISLEETDIIKLAVGILLLIFIIGLMIL